MADFNEILTALQPARQQIYDLNPFLMAAKSLANTKPLVNEHTGQIYNDPVVSGIGALATALSAGYGANQAQGQEGDLMKRAFAAVAGADSPGSLDALAGDRELAPLAMALKLKQQERVEKTQDLLAQMDANATAQNPVYQQLLSRRLQGMSGYAAPQVPAVPNTTGAMPGATMPQPSMPTVDASNPDLITEANQVAMQLGISVPDALKAVQARRAPQDDERKAALDQQTQKQKLVLEAIQKEQDAIIKDRTDADTLDKTSIYVTSALKDYESGPRAAYKYPFQVLGSAIPYYTGADKALDAKSRLDSVKADVYRTARTAGTGQVSDKEASMLLGSGPNSDQPVATNKLFAEAAREKAKLVRDYADFRELYMQTYKTTEGMAPMWEDYLNYAGGGKRFSIEGMDAQGNLFINKNRPDWRGYVSGAAKETTNAPAAPEAPKAAATPTIPGENPLLAPLIPVESGGNAQATSSAGAQGIAQIMPETGKTLAARRGMTNFNPYDPTQNKMIASDLLDELGARYGSNPELIWAAYHAGQPAVDAAIRKAGGRTDWASVQQFLGPKTRAYVPQVLASQAIQAAQGQSSGAANVPQAALLMAKQFPNTAAGRRAFIEAMKGRAK